MEDDSLGWALPPENWIASWENDDLQTFIDQVNQSSPDLLAAFSRMEAAFARSRITAANAWPQINASASAARSKQNTGPVPLEFHRNQGSLGLNLTWEIDLWGRLKNEREAALMDAATAAHSFYAARLSLLSSAAGSWFDLVEANAQVDLAERSLETFANSASRARELFERGVADALDVELLNAQENTARSTVAFRKRQQQELQRNLEILLGRYPSAAIQVPDQLPQLPAALPAGLPSTWLERRPDIRAAQSQLAATEFRLKVANKQRLPIFSLTANGGTSSEDLDNLVDPDFSVWSLIGNLTAPVFQGGRIRANQKAAYAEYESDLASYVQVVLNGYREVEASLSAEQFWIQQVEALAESTRLLRIAEELAAERYARGLVPINTLLDTRLRAIESESGYLNALNALHRNRIRLLLALGGDPLNEQAQPVSEFSQP